MAEVATQTQPGRTVLIVDDSAYARSRLRRFMSEQGFGPIVEATSGDEALTRQAESHPDLVLLDQVMRGRPGIDTAELMLAHNPDLHVIMLTVVTDRETHQKALRAGIERVLPKADLIALAVALRELRHG